MSSAAASGVATSTAASTGCAVPEPEPVPASAGGAFFLPLHPRPITTNAATTIRIGTSYGHGEMIAQPAQAELGLEIGQLAGEARSERVLEPEPPRLRALLHRRTVARERALRGRIDLGRGEVELLDETARRRQHARAEQRDRCRLDDEAGF